MKNITVFKRLFGSGIAAILASCLLVSQPLWAAENCSAVLAPTATTKPFVPQEQIKIVAYNLEEFFTREAADARGDTQKVLSMEHGFKPEDQIVKEREIIKEENPDIIVATEMHLEGDAKEFMDDPQLQGKYKQFLIPGNDSYGINIVMYLKSSLNFEATYTSHKDMTWTNPFTHQVQPLFSRDLPVLILKRPGENNPALIVIGNHAHSKRTSNGDTESNELRTAQYEGAKQVIQNLKDQYGSQVPIVLAGDFNTNVINAPEVNPIRDVVTSIFDSIKGKTFDLVDRVTHVFFGKDGERNAEQLDDIRVSGNVQVISVQVIHYEDASGKLLPLPQTYQER